MSVEQVIGNLVYAEGSELWIIPDKSSSYWSQKLDWYLNFQVSKASTFQRTEMADDLKDIVKEEEIDLTSIPMQEKSPLLIASPKHLPNTMTVVLSYDENKKAEWLEQIEKTWIELGKPSTRVFLPKFFNPKEFTEFCNKHLDGELTFVVESN